ncbi:uncharacterized protein PV09_01188 [Verruconis gallopava]|uniref:Amidase domain-containing protein n=1 Tax=Verruconis gallopava TaxID=253628 RepID=A0A0D2ANZ1_9PEZI|nr:uncharacterized protein PV09_01188 [Verruconis gallopava]KIW08265.1 hypothetical protein PV09_01188 [Verruconis gallopava]
MTPPQNPNSLRREKNWSDLTKAGHFAMTEAWQTLVAAKRKANAAKIPLEWRLSPEILGKISPQAHFGVLDIPRTCGILTKTEVELTENYTAAELLRMMANQVVTSYAVTLAFCKRAAIAQQLVNCLTEIFFDEALVRAKKADDHLAKTGQVIGPLHGLPISLKDSFNVIGVDATIGYVAFARRPPATNNSSVVEILIRAGAIPYVKTNLPQTMMTADSDNNLFGRTLNPNKLSLTAGGSTGGEGALLKIRGSILGVGTDVAGSIRIPSYCNGVFGFKPTSGRIPFAGGVPPGRLGAPTAILPTIGPEGHSVEDMELWMRTVIDSEPWDLDPNCLAVPWRRVEPFTRPLRLGVITDDPKRMLHPTVLRTIKSASEALKNAGHMIMPLDGLIPSIWESCILSWKYFALDPQDTPAKILAEVNEPLVPSISTTYLDEIPQGWHPSIDDLYAMNMERFKIIHSYHKILTENSLDGFIMPVYQATAVPHDTYGLPIWTVLPNLINYPAGVIPYLKADKKEDAPFVRTGVTYEPPYNADAVEGAPCGLQVVGRPMKDEETLKMMEVIANVLKATTSE